MIRILHVTCCMHRAGAETFIMNIYRQIDRSKIQFDFLVTCKGGDYEPEIEQMGGRVFAVTPRNRGIRQHSRELDKFFADHKGEFAGIHMHIPSLSWDEPIRYAKKYGVPIRVIHAHSSSIIGRWPHFVLHYAKRPFVRFYATDYLACSDKAVDWLFGWSGVKHKAKVINNGINTTNYAFNTEVRQKIRAQYNIGEGNVVLGHVGRFCMVKNHTFLLDIFNEYHKRNCNSKLMLVGDGPDMDKVKTKIASLGLDKSVILTGVCSNINELLQAMDIFVMPSLYEGLPVTLVEAQTADLPILASNTISHDSKLKANYRYETLSAGATAWADDLEDIAKSLYRSSDVSAIVERGFDIATTAKVLTQIYTRR